MLQQSSDPFANAQLEGVNATVSQFIGMHGRRERERALFREFFRDFDVLLAPVTITPAFAHISDEVPVLKRTLKVNDTEVPYLEDRTTITFASLLEREFGGFTPPPEYI